MPQVDVVISGGAVEGVCTATGFLRAVVDDLGHKVVCGAANSAGALVLGAHAAGVTPKKIEKVVLETDFTRFVSKPRWWQLIRIWKVLRRGWLSDGKKLDTFLQELTEGKTFKDANFDVRLVGSNYTNYSWKAFHKGNLPNMPIWKAMRISSSLPGAFKPVWFGGALWCDGGVRRHYPVDLVPPSKRPFYGWLLGSTSSKPVKVDSRPGAVGTITDYIDQATDATIESSLDLAERKPITVEYDDAYVGTFDFGLPREEKERLINLARKMTVRKLRK